MKSFKHIFHVVLFTLLTACLPILLFAQEKKVDVDINVGKQSSSQWYMSPVAWVVGGLVFILLLVALLRGRSKD